MMIERAADAAIDAAADVSPMLRAAARRLLPLHEYILQNIRHCHVAEVAAIYATLRHARCRLLMMLRGLHARSAIARALQHVRYQMPLRCFVVCLYTPHAVYAT